MESNELLPTVNENLPLQTMTKLVLYCLLKTGGSFFRSVSYTIVAVYGVVPVVPVLLPNFLTS
jgi:hypothetical protein